MGKKKIALSVDEETYNQWVEEKEKAEVSFSHLILSKLDGIQPVEQKPHPQADEIDTHFKHKYDQLKPQYDQLEQENEQLQEKIKQIQEQPPIMEEKEQEQSDLVMEEVTNGDESSINDLFHMKTDELEKKTDLTPKQIMAFARAKTYAKEYNVPVMNDFLKHYAEYAISKNRKGRSEFVDAFKAKILEPMGMGGMLNSEKDK